ncbi:MAG TPA: hypothetical protein VK859_04335, partial [bacterium]|nr:hypothetical protein [bacterium]
GGLHNFTSPGDANPQNASIANPWEPAISPDDSVLVAGSDAQTYPYNNFLVVLANPLSGDNPVTHLNDFDLQSYSAVFDDDGNLYVANHNRSRVFVYLKPFATPYPTPTPAPANILTCCQTVWDDPQGNSIFNPSTYGLAYDPSGPGTLYVGGGASIIGVNPATGASLGTLPVPAGTLNSVLAMAMGISLPQYLFAGDNGVIHKIQVPSGTISTTFNIGDGVAGICVDGQNNDNLYVGGASGNVYQVTQGGTITTLTLSGGPGYNSLGGLVLENGPGGAPSTLYVSYTGNGCALQFVQSSPGSTTYNYTATEQAGALEFPHQMVRDISGNIYLCQTGRYFVFDPSFNYVGTCLTSPVVPDAQGIAIDPQGNVYLGSTEDNHALLKLGCAAGSATPTPVACAPSLSMAATNGGGAALNSAGTTLYVSDDSMGQVDTFSSSGVSQAPIGPGLLSDPEGVAVDGGGNIYVADQAQDKVLTFNSGGGLNAQWGSAGSAPGQFQQPFGVGANSAGTSIYVADKGNSRVQVFAPAGAFLAQWGSYGISGNGNFSAPQGLALDQAGDVYVADSDTGLLQVFNFNGAFLRQWDVTLGMPLETAEYVAVGPNNLVYVTDSNGTVGLFDGAGMPLGFVQGGPGAFSQAEGVAAGSASWYLVDAELNKVFQFSTTSACPALSRTPTFTWTPSPTRTLSPTFTPSPTMTPTFTGSPTATPTFTPQFSFTPTSTANCCLVAWSVPSGGATFKPSTYGLAYDPSAPGTLYVGGVTTVLAVNPSNGVTFGKLPVYSGLLSSTNAMAMGQAHPEYLFVGDNQVVHKILVPGGNSPVTFGIGDYVVAMSVDGSNNDDL